MYSIRIEGNVREMLQRTEGLGQIDRKGLNATLGEGVRESTLERFKQSRDLSGKLWARSIRAESEGRKTLIQTSQLRNSIRVESDYTGFAVGTNAKHAATHQLGEPGRTIRAKRRKALHFQVDGKWVMRKKVTIRIPARPFLGLSEEDIQEMQDAVEDFISKQEE